MIETNTYTDLFASQRTHFWETMRHTTAQDRISRLKSIKKWMFDHQQEIRDAVMEDLRKPEPETDLSEIFPVSQEIDHACSHLKKWMKPESVSPNMLLLGTESYILREPKGVVEIIAPWNFPFHLAVGPLVSALAAGNCAIIKPSELAPATATLVEEMALELFPREEVAVVLGDHTVAEELGKLPFDHIFFTGSTAVGKKVMTAAAQNLTTVTLELGGCNPAIVDESVNLNDAAEKIMWGKFHNNGQACMSINYLLVHERVHQPLMKALVKAYEKMYRPDKIRPEDNPDLGRIIDASHFQRVRDLIQDSVKVGAEVIFGAEMIEEENYIAPTLLDHVPWESPIFQEEIFGPVLPMRSYADEQEILNFMAFQPAPLCLYLFGQDQAFFDRMVEHTNSGTVGINDIHVPYVHPHLPFGGVGESGMGKAHGRAGFMTFTHERPVAKQRIGLTSLKLIHPPFRPEVKRVIQAMMKWL